MIVSHVAAGHPVIHQMQGNLAIALAARGERDEAERLHAAAVAGLELGLGSDHADLVGSFTSYGSFLLDEARAADAAGWIERAAALAEAGGREEMRAVAARINRATLRREQGRLDEALGLYRAELEPLRQLAGDGSASVARIESLIAQTLVRLDRPEEAEALFTRALVVQEASPGASRQATAETTLGLGSVRCRRGNAAEGLIQVQQSCDTLSRLFGEEHWWTGACAVELGACEAALGRLETARARLEGAPRWFDDLDQESYWRVRAAEVAAAIRAADEAEASPAGLR
jgi:tetratricopeptide (TPR) repeat protein